MADIVYRYYDGVYLNITNQCPCNCAFCIRSKGDAVGDAKEMWFDTEPTWEEIKAAIDAYDFAHTDEAVFCGYGEPTNALDHLLQAADYLRTVNPKIHLRLNTNGLSDLINGKPTAELLCRHFDSISVSLNEPTAEKYDKITRNCYGGKAFDAMLDFAEECRDKGIDVIMSVVDIIGDKEVAACRELCEKRGLNLRVRKFE